MKVAPVSADLLIKLALGAAVVGLVVYGVRKAAAALPSAGQLWDTATEAADAINPLNQNNVAYATANKVGGSLVTDPAGPGKNADGSWTLGGWVYDVTH